ncbi:diacylglycerol kinase family protein [Saccharicrinis sp. FJH54]|uniref:diacylglycerol kinase family protein n=1 Tax=Saccharicrinis sp. FJH54 TaxID=3344665 RepID=UPI0035D490AF
MFIKKVLDSFRYAFHGIFSLFRNERNAQIQLIVFLVVCSAGFYFLITTTEWMIICLFSALVFGLEAVNTSIEGLSDVLSPGYDKRIKRIKDIAAGAVLIAALFAVIAGVIIFLPYILRLFK